jgi:hypothetical protein
MDDENTMVYNVVYSFGAEPLRDKEAIEIRRGRGPGFQTEDFKKTRNKSNNWLIDRAAQRTKTFTGIDGSILRIMRSKRVWTLSWRGARNI